MSSSAKNGDHQRRVRLLGTWAQGAAIALCAALGIALFTFVDLTPRVEGDFFFSTDDPQLQSSLRIEKEFGSAQQVFVAVGAPQLVSGAYLRRLHDLTEALRALPGVADVRSLTRGPEEPEEILTRDPEDVFEDLRESPFWTHLLLAPDGSATFIVLRLQGNDSQATVTAIDRTLARHARSSQTLAVSGVPYVAEHIRRRLADDLQRFSVAAFAAFALLVALLFRSSAVLVGTMVAALTTSFVTFLVRALLGMSTDILAPNLWTIGFVLTLSHVVYLTAQWQQTARQVGSERAVAQAMHLTGPASAWSLAANLLGFASLIFVSAKPLRAFGISGVIAALVAMGCAYLMYPPFLRAARPRPPASGAVSRWLGRVFTTRHSFVAALAVVAALVLAPLAWRVETDPTLPSYFARGDRIRTGLEVIDRAAGSRRSSARSSTTRMWARSCRSRSSWPRPSVLGTRSSFRGRRGSSSWTTRSTGGSAARSSARIAVVAGSSCACAKWSGHDRARSSSRRFKASCANTGSSRR